MNEIAIAVVKSGRPWRATPDFFIHVTVGASLNYKTGEPVNIYTSPVQA